MAEFGLTGEGLDFVVVLALELFTVSLVGAASLATVTVGFFSSFAALVFMVLGASGCSCRCDLIAVPNKPARVPVVSAAFGFGRSL